MAINLELPRKLEAVIEKAHQGAAEMLRPIARKWDLREHEYPVELDTLATLFEGIQDAKAFAFAGAEAFAGSETKDSNHNGGNMSAVLNVMEISWGDVALMLSVPRQGLGNAAISSVATPEQLEQLGKDVWAAMAITEPGFGSDSAAVTTTAKLDGDEYVINGEKIFVTAGSRATHIVVWATLDKSLGRAAIKSFIVPREHPGVTVERLEDKLGIKASDTAVIRFDNARIPKDNLLGSPEVHVEKGFAGVMETFDNTRPVVAAMAVGIARAALEELRKLLTESGVEISYDKPAHAQSAPAAEFLRMEADWEAAYLLMVRSAWQADNNIPNSKEASMGKAKAGRVASDITLKAVEIAGTTGYSEQTLLEKWARDSKIL
ncbi:MAG TPA: acyl-CoA dehydrogenase family protein, partial [Mycobacterium sp.]|nr:acyl-CoA dehydrogenase family protein [Mycobacterium sp.]